MATGASAINARTAEFTPGGGQVATNLQMASADSQPKLWGSNTRTGNTRQVDYSNAQAHGYTKQQACVQATLDQLAANGVHLSDGLASTKALIGDVLRHCSCRN